MIERRRYNGVPLSFKNPWKPAVMPPGGVLRSTNDRHRPRKTRSASSKPDMDNNTTFPRIMNAVLSAG